MRLLCTFILIIGLAGLVSADDLIEREFDVAKGGQLDIELTSGGSIDIEGWDKSTVAIEVELYDCDADDFNYEIEQRGDDVEVYFKLRRRINSVDIDVKVMVPHEYDIKLKTGGGGIRIANVTGRIGGRTGGGELDLDGLKGEVDLVTGGGSVVVENSEIDGRVTTGGGSVRVEDVVGDFKATSGGGNVVYRNVKTPDRDYSGDVVNISNAGGSLSVSDAPAGAELKTGGGDIDVRSAGEFVVATTGGGDITIDRVDGWIEASTGAGDVEVRMIGDPAVGRRDVELRTGSGDIVLTIPRDLSAEFDIELAYTKNYRGRCRIESDIDLEIEESDSWISDWGTPRKIKYGTATVNGGKNRIRIQAVNGDVVIRTEG